jgi:hypothetical protein|tara:strand:+ start:206 stop:592 length:387 start_codon:yes stop_codon:yes gene_type:complete
MLEVPTTQQDGFYPRVNGTMLIDPNSEYSGKIVSVMGRQTSLANGVLKLTTGDKETVVCVVAPDYEQEATEFVEVVGLVREGVSKEVDLYVTRPLGDEMNMELYNSMIELQATPKYQPLFRQPEFVKA